MDAMFLLLESEPDFGNCEGMIGLIEDVFSAIHDQANDPQLRDLSVLFYLQNIESIETASFHMLNLAAPLMKTAGIDQLLRENYDEAIGDLSLLRQIAANYFKHG